MMGYNFNMKIFQKEINDGLSDKLSSHSAKASAEVAIVPKNSAKAENFYPSDKEIVKNVIPEDMAVVNGILVTTNWNLNDDIFTPSEVIGSIYTPLYKPANIGHLGKETDEDQQIIGVIYNSFAVNDEYQPISPKENEKFHILVCIYLWEKYFPNKSKEIKDAIDRGEMSLSMECLFDNFGYGLKKEGTDKVSLLPRNEATAWLTKHLRAYGGKGKVKINGEMFKIGRWIKSPLFSGVAFVENPGNPESIIFQDYISHASAQEVSEIENFEESIQDCVLPNSKGIDLWPQ